MFRTSDTTPILRRAEHVSRQYPVKERANTCSIGCPCSGLGRTSCPHSVTVAPQSPPQSCWTTRARSLWEPHGRCARVCACIRVLCSCLPPFHSPSRSPKAHAQYVERYGRNVRIKGLGSVGAFQAAVGIQPIVRSHSGMIASFPLIPPLFPMCSKTPLSTRNHGSRVD